MAVVINTNVDSIKIQSCLSSATGKMSSVMQRMSTGLKVNSAKDDAAGCVIAAKMQVQLDGNKVAQTNVQNANSLLSTAEGNLDVVESNLVRIRDLTLQAKNGTYSKEEIKAMQEEVDQRIEEIDRISTSSKYSSLQLFGEKDKDGNAAGLAKTGATFQIGANSLDDNTLEANKSLFQSVKFSALTGRNGATVKYSMNNVISAAADSVASGAYTYVNCSATDENAIALYELNADGEATGNPTYVQKVKTSELTTAQAANVFLDTNNDQGGKKFVAGRTTTGLDLNNLDSVGIAGALDDLDDAINNITNRKSQIGSVGNRLESALDTLTTQFENLSSAKSVITDADIAAEASNYTQQSILQQVSTSLLAQANQAPAIALSLV